MKYLLQLRVTTVKALLAALFSGIVHAHFSQSNPVDSIQQLLKKDKEDTTKVNHLVRLGDMVRGRDPELSLQYVKEAKELSEKLDYAKGKEGAYVIMGIDLSNMGELQEGLKYLKMAQKVTPSTKFFQARALNGIGTIFWRTSNYADALSSYFKALKLGEEINHPKVMATSLGNICMIYEAQKEYKKSLEYGFKTLALSEKIGDGLLIADSKMSLGVTYYMMRDYATSIKYYNEAYTVFEEYGDSVSIAGVYVNKGNSLSQQGDSASKKGNQAFFKTAYKQALTLYERALKIMEHDDKDRLGTIYLNLGDWHTRLGNLDKAKIYIDKALQIGKEMGLKDLLETAYYARSVHDSASGRPADALRSYKLSVLYHDSIMNEASKEKVIQAKLNYDFEKKEAIAETEHKKELEQQQLLADEKSRKQTIVIVSVIAGLILAAGFAAFIFRSLRLTKRQKHIIERQKHEVEKAKELVEEKQKEIMDSINYAKRIQYALLASDTVLNNNLKTNGGDYFVLFKPKDIVAGDFYWATPTPDGFVYITADCTGHGVPGAFMSLLNISKLSETINEKKITRPDLVLNNVRTEIIAALNPEGSTEESKDGMDCVICKLDRSTMKLQYAAANNQLYIIRNGALMTLKADKMPVGKYHDNILPFTFNEISLEKGDLIYTLSDGFPDQFGGPKGKKFKYRQLEDLLVSLCQHPMEEQKTKLSHAFESWRGSLEQIDDVCILGIKV